MSTFTTVPNLFLHKQSFSPISLRHPRITITSFDQNANPESRSVFFFFFFFIPLHLKFPHILFICVRWWPSERLCARGSTRNDRRVLRRVTRNPLYYTHTQKKAHFAVFNVLEVYCNVVKTEDATRLVPGNLLDDIYRKLTPSKHP